MDAIWPRQNLQVDAALKVLDHMEFAGVVPNGHTFHSMLGIFGKASQPVKKVRRMAYWMRKMMHANPFSISLLPEEPKCERSFLRYCAQRMAGDLATCHGGGGQAGMEEGKQKGRGGEGRGKGEGGKGKGKGEGEGERGKVCAWCARGVLN